jgi:hypothetical protein
MNLDLIQLECSTVLHNSKTNVQILNRVLCSSSEGSTGASDYIHAQKVWLNQNLTSDRTIIISDFFNHIRFLRYNLVSSYIGGHVDKTSTDQAINDYNSKNKPLLFVHSLAFDHILPRLEKAKHVYVVCPQASIRYLDIMSKLLDYNGTLHVFYSKTVAISVWSAVQFVKRCAHFGLAKTNNVINFMQHNECASNLAEAQISFFHDDVSLETSRSELILSNNRNLLAAQFISTLYSTNKLLTIIVDSGSQSNNIQNLLRTYGIPVFACMRLDDGSKLKTSPNAGVYFMSIKSFYAAYTRINWPVFMINPLLEEYLYNSQLFTEPGPTQFYYLVSKNCKASLTSFNTLSYLAETFGVTIHDIFCD